MDKNRELHIRRLRESLQDARSLDSTLQNAHTPGFKTWKSRTEHSLSEVFGKDHAYSRDFGFLNFWLPRVSLGRGPVVWTPQDEIVFERDKQRATALLDDALDEVDADAVVRVEASEARSAASRGGQTIVVNVQNVLSNIVTVSAPTIVAQLESMGLDHGDLEIAQREAHALVEESNGQRRWPVLAKSLETLQKLGKPVYEKVALPLLLEMLKRQIGA